MTLGIVIVTIEGIVLAVDNKTFYYNPKNKPQVSSEILPKLYQLNRRIGVIIAERGFLAKNTIYRRINNLFCDFRQETKDILNLNVKNAAKELYSFFSDKSNWKEPLKTNFEILKAYYQRQEFEIKDFKIEEYPGKVIYKDSQDNIRDCGVTVDEIEFMVAGYNKDDYNDKNE